MPRFRPVQSSGSRFCAAIVFVAELLGCGPIAMAQSPPQASSALPWIRVDDDRRGFSLVASSGRDGDGRSQTTRPFVPWGFNYDHDRSGRLLEDYWHDEWRSVEEDFQEMQELGANVVRIHLQLGRFLSAPDKPDDRNLRQLAKLVKLAESRRMYLDVTGLGCYHKADVPAWYDELAESARWDVQARFWEEVARVCRGSPAIFCYDLMNEPVSPAGRGPPDRWLGPPFAGKHFVQYLATDQAGRDRWRIAKAWIERLVVAIRRHDDRHLITVGLVDWSLDRPGLTSGLVPDKISERLDFLAVHLYPQPARLAEDLETLAAFARVGKPVVIEETFPLRCSPTEFREFLDKSRVHAAGHIGFYWGETEDELQRKLERLKRSDRPADERLRESIGVQLQLEWLRAFRELRPK